MWLYTKLAFLKWKLFGELKSKKARKWVKNVMTKKHKITFTGISNAL